QRENRRLVAAHAANKDVLNCFSYTGAMSVHCLAQGARHVTEVDASETALALGRQQLALNGLDESACTQVTADVFAQLRTYRAQGRQFDLIILDPPKFVENKQHLAQACRGYKDIN